MKWFLEEPIPVSATKIQHGDICLFMGSCFSENIFEKGKRAGLHFLNSQFGTLFHPLAIARNLINALDGNYVDRIHYADGRYYSWDAYTKFNQSSEENLRSALLQERNRIKEILSSARFLFLTFGSAKAYKLEGEVVANCHKAPAIDFEVELSDLSEMVDVYRALFQSIRIINPDLQIVCSVSPVRHSREGLIVNNRSKARLLLLCEELAKIDTVDYFPAYELVIDQLRDYRFYSSDLVHPNSDAIAFIWEKFQETFLTTETISLIKEVEKRRTYFEHRSIHSETDRERQIRSEKERELEYFLKLHPQILW